jgi:cobalt-zinc-cadmium efflux system outer membrane protein
VTVYRKGVRDQAARNLEVVRQTYGYGRIPLLDVIAEQRRFIDIETGYTDVLFDAYASRVALERAVGTSLP